MPPNTTTSTESDKPFGITYIGAYVPLVLDLEELNYDTWRELFETHCLTFGVLSHLTTIPAEQSDSWKKLDSLVKLWLYGTISKPLIQMILKKGLTAHDVWQNLENLFRDNKDARAMQLEHDLRTITIGDLSVTDYCQKIKTISDLLANIDSAVPEKTLVSYMVNGLSDKYDQVAGIIRHKDPLPSFLQVRSMLLLEESILSRRAPVSAVHRDHSSAPTVLHVGNPMSRQNSHNDRRANGGRNQPRNNNNNRRQNDGNNRRSDNRRQQQPATPPPWLYWGAPPPWMPPTSWFPSAVSTQQAHHNNWAPRSQQPQQQWGNHPQWTNQPQWANQHQSRHNQTSHPVAFLTTTENSTAWPTDQMTTLPQNFNTLSLDDPGSSGWFMDTGATSHLTADTSSLSSISNKCNISSIYVGDGSTIPVTNMGHSTLPSSHRTLHLHNVLVTPQIIKNLISVRKFVRDNKCSIEFEAFGFSVKDFKTRRVLLRCDSTGDLHPVTSTKSSHVALLTSSPVTWHQRLGHPGNEVLQSLISSQFISCNRVKMNALCHACQLGKHTRLPFSRSTSIVHSPFDLIHSDLWTSPVSSNSGLKYYILFLDHFSHYVWVYPLRRKCDALSKFIHFRNIVKTQFKTEIKEFQCDHGGEFDNLALHTLLDNHGIHIRFSCPKTSQQNGKSERMIRSINNFIRTLLFHAHIPPTYWVEALLTATHLLNLLPSKSINNEIPFVKLFNKQPSYSHLRVFGCLCFPHKNTSHKLVPRSSPCIFLGYPSHHRGYRCLDLSTKKIILSRHVTFDESVFPFASMTPTQPPSYTFLDSNIEPNAISKQLLTSPSPSSSIDNPTPHQESPSQLYLNLSSSATAPTSSVPPQPRSTHPMPPSSSHQMTTRSKQGITKPIQRLNLLTTSISPIPRSHLQALKDSNWKQAMRDEYNALIKNNTWTLVPRPASANVVRCMWLFKHKNNADGSLSRYKARLVANGRSQQPGFDCSDTFSPVVKPTTIRTVLSIAVSRGWPAHQLDVKNAFLHGQLAETVYLFQPPGFVDTANPSHVCLLQKSLYGLKQAPRAWFQRFATYAISIGFAPSKTDSSLFVYKHGSDLAYLLLYVDDIILIASSQTVLTALMNTLSKEFAMTDLGQLNYFLGISVTRSSKSMFYRKRNMLQTSWNEQIC